MNVHTYKILPVKIKVQVDVIDTESFAWVNELPPEDFIIHKDKFCSHNDRIGYVVASEKNDVVGAITLLRRTIVLDGIPLILGGIGGVCTRNDKRKNGVGTMLVEKAMGELKRVGCDIAYLCTDVTKEWMVNFYQKFGFVRLVHGHTYTGKSGKRYTEFDGMIAPVCSKQLFQRIGMIKKPFDIGRGNW
ncbi:MAG: GNAT family N-acetyltransferase [Patescibacteria group bacterium]